MLTVATVLWDPNPTSFAWSRSYTEEWVVKLRNQFSRHLTRPFKFVCYVDRLRDMPPMIEQRLFSAKQPSYIDCLQPFEMGEPMILVGLDTLILRNIDHLADWCMQEPHPIHMALPIDPFYPERFCNGVMLVPAGREYVWNSRIAHSNDDMLGAYRWQPCAAIDRLFPGSVVSFKAHVQGERPFGQSVQPKGIAGVDVVYFHGVPKMADLLHVDWIREAWQ